MAYKDELPANLTLTNQEIYAIYLDYQLSGRTSIFGFDESTIWVPASSEYEASNAINESIKKYNKKSANRRRNAMNRNPEAEFRKAVTFVRNELQKPAEIRISALREATVESSKLYTVRQAQSRILWYLIAFTIAMHTIAYFAAYKYLWIAIIALFAINQCFISIASNVIESDIDFKKVRTDDYQEFMSKLKMAKPGKYRSDFKNIIPYLQLIALMPFIVIAVAIYI